MGICLFLAKLNKGGRLSKTFESRITSMRVRATVAIAVTTCCCDLGSYAFLSGCRFAIYPRAVSAVRISNEISGDELSSDGGSAAPPSEGKAILTVAVLKAECKARGLKVRMNELPCARI